MVVRAPAAGDPDEPVAPYPSASDGDDAVRAYLWVLHADPLSMRDLDLDAFADGVVAHRAGLGFHENPHGADALTVARLSWSMGWNERALAKR